MGWKTHARGIVSPEGPAADPAGNLYLVSRWTGNVVRISNEGMVSTVTETGGKPQSVALLPSGDLLLADAMNGALERITALGERSTVATAAAGEPFLGPNDLVVAGDRVYMTDPGLDLEGSGRIVSIELPSGTAHIVADGLRFPNGITMSAAGDALWVAESTSHRILRFSLSSAGEVGAAEVFYEFADHHPDGIAFDADGNLLVTLCGAGMLHVLDPLADLIDSIPTGGLNCTNCVFGGPAFDTLFLTEDFQEAVLSMQWPVPGQKQYSRSLPHDFELRLAEEEPVS